MENFFKNKKILVIGGTGTIGSSIVRTLLKKDVDVVRIFSRDEHKQFELQQELDGHRNVRFLLGDVRDYSRLRRAMEDIDIVFHAAALKHVPSCEYNPFEAVKTNVIGTQNVINAAISCNVEKVILTSTDKTIGPTNTYGATKLLAERLVSSAEYYKGSRKISFAAVRFGNVMGSRGSVIPLLKKQILEKGYVTITDGEMTRFMMTISQAINLTVEACKRAKGGEVFVLKMPAIKLKDLVDVIIEETCKNNNLQFSKIEKKVIGLRPGEKMFEELMTLEESKYAIEFDDMFAIQPLFKEKIYDYGEGKIAQHKTYSSHNEKLISKEEIREMLTSEGLV